MTFRYSAGRRSWRVLVSVLVFSAPGAWLEPSCAGGAERATPARASTAAAQPSEISGANAAGTRASSVTRAASPSQLVERLGHPRHAVREWAERKLRALGFEAFDALDQAQDHEDLEIAARARFLLTTVEIPWVAADAPPMVREALNGYESLEPQQRRHRIRRLAYLVDGQGLPALARVIRFEPIRSSRSAPLAEFAAAVALDAVDPSEVAPTHVAEARAQLGRSDGEAAELLRALLTRTTDAALAADQLQQIAFDQASALDARSSEHARRHAMKLLQTSANWSRAVGRPDAQQAALAKRVDLQQEDAASLFELIVWLTENDHAEVVDDVVDRFGNTIDQNAHLLFAVSEAKRLKGDNQAAEKLAEQADELLPEDAGAYLRVAVGLQEGGLLHPAERQYRHVLELAPKGPGALRDKQYILAAQSLLSYMLFDHGRYEDAADVIEAALPVLESLPAGARGGQEDGRDPLAAARANLHMYRAKQYQKAGRHADRITQLKQALQHDPQHADVLIGLYRSSKDSPSLRTWTMERIEGVADQFLEQIKRNPGDATPYNQYAWLIANTEGDYQRALRYSLRSLELQPNVAGYLDTLGRCYYAVGDLERAVVNQRLAVANDPHSGQLQAQLKLFERELAKSRAE